MLRQDPETGIPYPVWEAVSAHGQVVGTWVEAGVDNEDWAGVDNEDWVRDCAAKFWPDCRLRVTRFTKTTEWAD